MRKLPLPEQCNEQFDSKCVRTPSAHPKAADHYQGQLGLVQSRVTGHVREQQQAAAAGQAGSSLWSWPSGCCERGPG